MYRAIVTIKGISALSQSRQHYCDKLEGESHEAYDLRCWREKANYDQKTGEIFVPNMAFKQSLDASAKRLAIPDPDNKRANFTKFFVSDVLCESNMPIGVFKDKIGYVDINANVDGVRGSGKRVRRRFPQTPEWGGTVSFLVMEEKITPEIFERVMRGSGRSIGVGQFRPEKGGVNGRFEVTKIKIERI